MGELVLKLKSRSSLQALICFCAWIGIATEASAGTLYVKDAWARPTPPGIKIGAAYLTVVNEASADVLLGADTKVAARVEFHETKEEGGIMQMRRLKQVECPRGTTRAAPAGLHLMLIDLTQPLAAGTHFPLTLKFKNAGETTVEVSVESRQ